MLVEAVNWDRPWLAPYAGLVEHSAGDTGVAEVEVIVAVRALVTVGSSYAVLRLLKCPRVIMYERLHRTLARCPSGTSCETAGSVLIYTVT